MTLKRDTLIWNDGDMPFSQTFGDHFYAREDGRAECGHVFMGGNGLPARWIGADAFTIGELGFGTGLNFLETWRQWQQVRAQGQILQFVSFEAYPMEADAIRKAIGRWPALQSHCDAMLGRWDTLTDEPAEWVMDDQTRLTVVVGQAADTVPRFSDVVDAWYLDGFAPSRNETMWSAALMQAVFDKTRAGGTFATYTAAGWVRRNLQAAGFSVEKTRGYGGKRDMARGTKATAKG